MKKIHYLKKLMFLFTVMLITGTGYGQLTGIKTIPGDYANIALAITDLNTQGVGAGGVTFNVATDYTETFVSPTAGLITATGTSADPIVFQKSGAGANPVITAGVGVGTVDGIIVLRGSDYVTFDGINLSENALNLSATTQMEWGYAFVKTSATDGARYNEIKNCTVTLNKTNVLTAGIYFGNHTDANNTALTITDVLGTNSFNKVNGNTVTNAFISISFKGSTIEAYFDQSNEIGLTTGNTLSNFGGASTSYSIYLAKNNNFTIANNSITNSGTTSTVRGIYIAATVNASGNIYNNNIQISSSALTNQLTAIESAITGTGTLNIYNNNIHDFSFTTATTGTVYLLYQNGAIANLNIYNNTIANNSAAGTGNYGAIYTTSTITNVSIYGNTISGNSKTGISGTMYCIRANTGSISIHDNIITNNTVPSTTGTGTAIIYGYYNFGSPLFESIYNNQINGLSIGGTSTGTQTIYGIYSNTTAAAVKSIYSNNINNLNVTTGNGLIYGINNALGAPTTLYKNSIYNLSSAGTGGLTYGMYISSGTTNIIYNNFISDIKAPAATGTNAVNGINISGGTTANVFYNTIYLNASSSSATTFGTSGIYKSSTTTGDFRNNIVVNVSTPGATGGFTVAYRWSGAYNATYYSASSNSNNFYAGTPSTTNLIFYDGINSDQTIVDYQTRVSGRDGSSITENSPFINVATIPYNLHLNPIIATLCEAGGTPITTPVAITTDFDEDIRNVSTPDIGADEGNFDIIQPTVTFVPLTGATAVPVGDNIILTFSESVRKTDNSPIDASVITFYNNSDAVAVTSFTIGYSNKVLTVTPSPVLLGTKNYTVTVSGVEDLNDNALVSASTTFTTGSADAVAPLYVSSSVENAASSNVVVVFDENIAASSAAGFTVNVDGTPATISGYAVSGTNITLTLSAAVTSHQVITIAYDATTGTVKDVSNNLLATFAATSVTNNVKSSAKDILSFNLTVASNPTLANDIIGAVAANTITLTVPSSLDLTALIPDITNSLYSSVNPLSGVANNFNTNLTYTVTAEDLTTKAYTIVINKIFGIPYTEGFETGHADQLAISNYWTQSAVTGTNVWTANSTATTYNRTPRTGTWNAYIKYSNDRWMFSPAIAMEAGKTYTFTMYARQDGATATDANITVSYGNSAAIAAMTNVIVPSTSIINGSYQAITANFSPATSGTYNVGIKGYISSSPWYISVDDISIAEAPPIDAATTSVNALWTINGGSVTPTATVKNKGLSDATFNTVLTVLNGATTVHTETIAVTALASNASLDITFASFIPSTVGELTVNVETMLTGDLVPANNSLSSTLNILNPDNIAYAYSIFNESTLPAKAPVVYDLTAPGKIYAIADHSTDTYNVWGGDWVNGTWYAVDRNNTAALNRLITLDPATGTKTVVNASITAAFSDMAYDYSTNTMYGIYLVTATTYNLSTIDLTTGVITQVGTTQTGTPITLACNLSGQLYTIFSADGKLYSLDKTNAATTAIGLTGLTDIKYVQSMAFDHNASPEVLYWNHQGDVVYGNLYTVNTTTGTATVVGPLQGLAELTAFAIPYSVPTYAVTFSVAGTTTFGDLSATVDNIAITSPANVVEGKDVVFTAAAAAGFRVKEWKLNDVVIPSFTDVTYTLSNLTAISDVKVEFEAIPATTYAVTFSVVGSNGTLGATVGGTAIVTNALVPQGSNVVFTAAPAAGYQVKEWKLNDVVIPSFTDVTYTLSNLTAISDVKVEFELIPVNTAPITFVVNNTHGQVYTALYIKGSWNALGEYDESWSGGAEHSQFYDDGTHGDVTAGDHNWSVTLGLVPDAGANSWQWGFNDENHNWVAGNFVFTVTDATPQTLTYDVPSGVDEINNKISVYPNPSTGFIYVANANNSNVIVRNLTGQQIVNQKITSDKFEVNLTTVAKGMYFIQIDTNVYKVIVK